MSEDSPTATTVFAATGVAVRTADQPAPADAGEQPADGEASQ